MSLSTSSTRLDVSKLDSLETILLSEIKRERDTNKLRDLYPDDGPLRRELYPKHLDFFTAGLHHFERAAIAANRVGKTWGIGGYETALHLTGLYPEWWPGRRFVRPLEAWAAGDTSETTRDIVQQALMGPIGEMGTGLIPASRIVGEPSKRMGVAGAIDIVRVTRVGGGISQLGFKSYDQGRKKFQGTNKSVIWLDEEPPSDVYDECLLRLMTNDGLMLCTFTPLLGLSDVALRYLPDMAPETE